MKQFLFSILVVLAGPFLSALQAAEMRLAVTTSFHNSGLSDVLIPEIKRDLDLDVRLLVVGTGQALKLGRSGDVDAILVHSRRAEDEFVAEGFGTHRREIMYNDFVIVGPLGDPAAIGKATTAIEALIAISTAKTVFVSRGDDSGTHRRELALWARAKIKSSAFTPDWYRAAGSGMGATLNTASGMNGYVLSDRASWLKFRNKGNLKILFQRGAALFNQYAYLPVSSAKHPHVKSTHAAALENWLTSAKAQTLIGGYRINDQVLFTPNAKPENDGS
ncbi:MAG: substrate-binding domain-containing protein [Pseudomonadota bacterium]